MTPSELASALSSKDDQQRAAGIRAAARSGLDAIPAVSPLLANPDTETRRAAKRALTAMIHRAGRPGATQEAAAAEKALLAVLQSSTAVPERRELLWLISEIGGDDSAGPVSALLSHPDLREDARCVLQRIPGRSSLRALQAALKSAPEDFRYAVAESLRKRGEKVSGYPSRRLVPSKPTSVTAAG